MTTWGSIRNDVALAKLKSALSGLIGAQLHYISIPKSVAEQMEPSQIGTIVGTITDIALPTIALEKNIGLTKADGILGDREGYPDFEHDSGYRIELKGLFKDNPKVKLKRPPTVREPSARLTSKVTVKNVDAEKDSLLIVVYELAERIEDNNLLSPTIVDIGLFPIQDCIEARDQRMVATGGQWFGNYETPTILSKSGKLKHKNGQPLNRDRYGRKESEGCDFNEDTNFGKLKRIPYNPLQKFLLLHKITQQST